ncbi:MAG: hypothetical protein NVS1B10_07610 [Candidatus Saccharimonadales bacterium]
MIKEVIYFNQSILKVDRMEPKLLPIEEATWLRKALWEEVKEFQDAHWNYDLIGSVDALIDLLYFTIGGLYRLGLNEDQIEACFALVHSANLTKKLGVKPTRPQDGTVADAIKDSRFTDPKELIREVLHCG